MKKQHNSQADIIWYYWECYNYFHFKSGQSIILQYCLIVSSSSHPICTNVKQMLKMKQINMLGNKWIYGINNNSHLPTVKLSTEGSGFHPGAQECFCHSFTQLSWPVAMTGSFVYLVFTFQHEIYSCLDSLVSGALWMFLTRVLSAHLQKDSLPRACLVPGHSTGDMGSVWTTTLLGQLLNQESFPLQ